MLFNRKKYKEFAKIQLKDRMGIPILMFLAVSLVALIFQLPSIVQSVKLIPQILAAQTDAELQAVMINAPAQNKGILFDILQNLILAILNIAALNVYLKMSRSPEPVSFSNFIESLNLWKKAILGYLWNTLWVTLWTFLFIIPGIVKSIAYSQMFYIICEYPHLHVSKAMNISKLITNGHKADLFVMFLSFLGWILLACLTCGIGFIWLAPYMKMSFVNSYHALMKDALETGILRPEDLA